MTCGCDIEYPSVFSETFPVARKPHRCCECYQTINPRDLYQNCTLLFEGEWATYKTCERCSDLRESLKDVMCIPFEGLKEGYLYWLVESGANSVKNHLVEFESC